jgi:ATP-dependent DNA helicase PIF1
MEEKVKKMMNNIIEATILNGKFKEKDVLLPRIPMIPTDMPFDFKRLQFPVRLVIKAQEQSLQVCELNLESPCFSHGPLCMWLAHALENLPIYSCTHQKEKQKIL